MKKHYIAMLIVLLLPMGLGYYASQHPDVIWMLPAFHYYYIILSCVASLLVGIFAYREYSKTQDFKVYLLSIGFIGITILYGVHGLVTPGKTLHEFHSHAEHINAFVFFGDMSRLWIGMFMFLQVMTSNRERFVKTNNEGFPINKRLGMLSILVLLSVFSILALYYPDYFPSIKDAAENDTHYAILIKVATLVLLGVACTRYYDSYRILKNAPVLSLIIACIFIMETVVLFMISKPWGLLWWLAHNLYLLSFISVGIGLFISSRKAGQFDYFNVHTQIENYIDQLSKKQEELAVTNQKLNELATKDPLTGLPNRTYIHHHFNDAYLGKWSAQNLAIIFIDLDGFKNINDSYGHDTGDQLLREVADILTNCVRSNDIVARLGGDEFLVVLHKIQEKECIEIIARRIISSLTKPITVNGNECKIGASLGISCFPEDGTEFGQLIRKADATMYIVKERGKNHFLFYSDIKKELRD